MQIIKKRARFLSLPLAFLACTAVFSVHAATQPKVKLRSSSKRKSLAKRLAAQTPNLSPKIINLGLLAYAHAREQGLDKQGILTIVNFDEPSTDKQLYVFNLKTDKLEYNTLVAHGKGSGLDYATHFSNQPNSDASSLGTFVTGQTYDGEHGESLRLHGLEKGFNNNAFSRDVVMHSAWYVSPKFAASHGRLGRSWGCFALSQTMEPKVVNAIKDGSIIFAYYPQQNWLQNSSYLKPLS